jgi:hypothetical protein
MNNLHITLVQATQCQANQIKTDYDHCFNKD